MSHKKEQSWRKAKIPISTFAFVHSRSATQRAELQSSVKLPEKMVEKDVQISRNTESAKPDQCDESDNESVGLADFVMAAEAKRMKEAEQLEAKEKVEAEKKRLREMTNAKDEKKQKRLIAEQKKRENIFWSDDDEEEEKDNLPVISVEQLDKAYFGVIKDNFLFLLMN